MTDPMLTPPAKPRSYFELFTDSFQAFWNPEFRAGLVAAGADDAGKARFLDDYTSRNSFSEHGQSGFREASLRSEESLGSGDAGGSEALSELLAASGEDFDEEIKFEEQLKVFESRRGAASLPIDGTGNGNSQAQVSHAGDDAAVQNVEEKAKAVPKRWIQPSRFVAFFGIIVLSMQQLAGTPLPFGFSEVQWEGLPNAPLPGHPERGDFFTDSSQAPAEVEAQLRQAVPVGWRGGTSENYVGANAEIAGLAQQLSTADNTMARYVNEQAERISQAQLRLGIEQDALIAAYPLICYLESPSRFQCYWIAWILAVSCVTGAVTECIYVLTDCNEASKRRRDQADDIDYSAITRAAHELIECYRFTPSEPGRSAARTRLTTFADVLDRGAAASARSTMATGVAAPHRVGGGPAHTPLGAATGSCPPAASAPAPSQPASGTPLSGVAGRPAVLHAAAAHPAPERGNGAGQLGQQPAPAVAARSGNSQQPTAGAAAGRRAPVEAAAVGPHQALKPRPARVEAAANRPATLADAWSHD